MKHHVFFLGIVIVAAILRFWQLGNVPPSPDWDEVALGYNAYSLATTGRDEYGAFLPVVLRSFDDYKPALYAYLVIPFIKLFGLEVFAVRLPSVLFGIATVIATYFLVHELFKRRGIALLTSFLLAISPWHLQFSRVAFESNVGLALNVLAILFFFKGLKNPWLLLVAFFFAGFSLHVYQSEKVFLPILALALLIIYRKELLALPKKYLWISFLTGFLLALPIAWYIVTQPQALLRARGTSFFADQTPFLARSVERLVYDKQTNDFVGLVLDNRRITYAAAAISGYLSHFDLNWLFITGDEPRHHAPNMGLLYLSELPFLLIGIYSLAFGKFDKRVKYLLFSWFLVAPIPASITTGVPHPIRTLNFLPTFQIFTALGIFLAAQKASSIKYQIRYVLFALFFSFFVFNFSYYLDQYFVQQNYYHSQEWQYGYKEAVSEVKKIEGKYRKVVVSNKPHLDQSYMFFLFYLQYPPYLYQKEAQGASGGFREEHKFDKFEFRPIQWEGEEMEKILFVGRPEDFPSHARVLKTIYFLNGRPAIKLVEG